MTTRQEHEIVERLEGETRLFLAGTFLFEVAGIPHPVAFLAYPPWLSLYRPSLEDARLLSARWGNSVFFRC